MSGDGAFSNRRRTGEGFPPRVTRVAHTLACTYDGISKRAARTAGFAVRVFSSMGAVNQRRGADGELWQPRFFDRALRSVKEYNEKVEYTHLNAVRAGLVSRPEDWRWSSYNEYAGMSAEEQNERCGLIVDGVRMPSDPRARI